MEKGYPRTWQYANSLEIWVGKMICSISDIKIKNGKYFRYRYTKKGWETQLKEYCPKSVQNKF